MSTDRATEANGAAVICALIGVVGTAMGVVGFWNLSETPLRVVQAVGILINGAGLLFLRTRRPPYSRALSNAVFLIVLVPTMVMTWMVDDARAAHSARWVPYEPNKLSALTLGVIAPPGWATGIAAIVMFVGSAVVHHVVLTDELRARMAAGEPFGVLAYGVFAFGLLGFRQRSLVLRDELEHARSEKLALEHVAQVAMALRDLANTPVQILELVRQELLIEAPELRRPAERMARALVRLRLLNDLLLPYQNAVTWDDKGHDFEGDLLARCRVMAASGSGNAARSRAPPARRPPA